MLQSHKKLTVNPNDLAEMLQLRSESEVDISFKTASTLSSLINYLEEGDSLSVSGITFYKTSDSSVEILNTLDDKDLLELVSE